MNTNYQPIGNINKTQKSPLSLTFTKAFHINLALDSSARQFPNRQILKLEMLRLISTLQSSYYIYKSALNNKRCDLIYYLKQTR
jgi:hypothetical protein